MNCDDALAIVDSLYASALGEAAWTRALERLADGASSAGATLQLHDMNSGRLLGFDSARLDPAGVERYRRDYVWRSPRVEFLKRSKATVAFDHLFITEEEMDRDAFYQEFLAPIDLRYFTAVQTPAFDGRVLGTIVVLRGGRVRGYSRENVEAMRLLQPHITRALRLYWHRIRDKVDPEYFDRLMAGFGLTLAERRLAVALMLGEALPAHARRTRRSMNTVYTHYRRIKAKLDCATQAELLARLHALGDSLNPGNGAVSPS
jgi:DNA-binding CsgD family transcriptional regulator